MNRKPFLSIAIAGLTLLGTSLALATPGTPSDEELRTQCHQYAVEDGIAPEGREEYVLQCILDMKERHLPVEEEAFDQNPDAEFDPELPPQTDKPHSQE